MQLQQSLLTLRSYYLRVQSKASHVASETLVHTLLRALCVVRELVLRLCKCVVRELVVHRRGERVVRV
jgi:hypothetical protein